MICGAVSLRAAALLVTLFVAAPPSLAQTTPLTAPPPPGAGTIPLRLPLGSHFVVDHSDQRRLPDGTSATFSQQHRLSFADDAAGAIATYQVIRSDCDGPAAICAAFTQLTRPLVGMLYRFRVGADGSVVLHDRATALTGDAQGEHAVQLAAAVEASEADAPGAILAADLRQLVRFAGMALPEPGAVQAVDEGRLAVIASDAATASLTIERAAISAAAPLNGTVHCVISRATGLAQRCESTDWVGDNRAAPLRIRTLRLVPAAAPVL